MRDNHRFVLAVLGGILSIWGDIGGDVFDDHWSDVDCNGPIVR